MTHATAFPDFPLANMPSIPATWLGISWHNDTVPSFRFMASDDGASGYGMARVWVFGADPTAREYGNDTRYIVTFEGAQGVHIALESDDWQDVLAYVETRCTLADSYVALIGYNPFLDDPTIDPAIVETTLAERGF